MLYNVRFNNDLSKLGIKGYNFIYYARTNIIGHNSNARGYLSGTRCRLACGPADATATHCLFLQ